MTYQTNEVPHKKSGARKAKAALLGVTSLVALNISFMASAQQAQASSTAPTQSRVQISIPAQSMASALNSFAKQVGKQIVFYSDDAKSLRAGPINGSLTERDALNRILNDSGLEYVYVNDRTIGIRRKSGQLSLTKSSFQEQDPDNAVQDGSGQTATTTTPSGTIVVTGRRLDQNTAIGKKRDANQIIDTITADQSSRLPDNNVVESLGRIPGVSFLRDSDTGDGTNISIRGLDSALNNIQFDGINAGQSGADGTRRVGLEGISADDIAELRVAKSLLPQDEGEGIGGAVNIITKTPLERGEDRFDFGLEGRAYDFNSKEGFQANAGFTKIFSDNFGINLSASFRRRETLNYRINGSDASASQFTQFKTINGDIITPTDLLALNADLGGNRFLDAGTLLNDVLPGQVPISDIAFQSVSYSVNDQTRDTFNISGSADWQISSSTRLTLGGRFNYEERTQDIHKLDFESEDENFSLRPDGVLRTDFSSSQTGFRLEVADRERTSASAYLRGKSDFGRLRLDYQASYSTETNKSPDSEVSFLQTVPIRTILRNQDVDSPVTSNQQFAPFGYVNRYFPTPNPGILTIPGFTRTDGAGNPVLDGAGNPVTFPGFDVRLGDVNNSYKSQTVDIQQIDDNKNDRYAFRFDGEYDLDAGNFRALKFGAKYERSDTHTDSRRVNFGDGRFQRDGTFSADAIAENDDIPYGEFTELNTTDFVSLDNIGNPLADYPISGIPRIDSAAFRGFVDNFNRTLDDRAPSSFTIRDLREEIWAGYAQAEFEAGRFSLVGGVRVEHYKGRYATTQRIETARFVVDNRGAPLNGVRTFIPLLNDNSLQDQIAQVVERNNDTQILPRLNAKYELTDNLLLRGGFGYSLARPSLGQLSQTGEIDFDINIDNAPSLLTATSVADIIAAGGLPVGNIRPSSSTDLDIERGNPQLKPARSRNIDLSLEWYPRLGTSISVGVFHKRINNFIFINSEPAGTFDGNIALSSLTDQFSPDTVALFAPFGGLSAFLTGPGADLIDVSLLQPQNGGTATIKGIEFGVNHQFDWAPGLLKNVGFSGNITYTDSNAELPVGRYDSSGDFNVLLGDAELLEDLPLRQVPFFNSPEVTANALLYYDANGLDIGLSYSYQSASFNDTDQYGFNKFDDSYGQFDFSIAYELPKKIFGGEFKIYLEIPDFTDGGRKPTAVRTVGKGSQLYDLTSFNGREYRFGIRGKF